MSGHFLKLSPKGAPNDDRARVFFVDTPSKNLICPLCQDVFDDPVISECGHTFCRQCINRQNPAHCPVHLDRKLSVVVDNLAVREQIGDLNVRCQYGVRWITRPNEQEEAQVCGPDSSTAAGSGGTTMVGVVVEDGCPDIIKYNERGTHEQTCAFALVTCPNSAECARIRKKDMEAHLSRCRADNRCCSFHSVGCPFSGDDGQLAAHEQSECRFEPMRRYFGQLDAKLQDQSEQLKEKDREITYLRSMLSKLSEKVDELEQKLDALHESSARTELDVVEMRREFGVTMEGESRRGSLIRRDIGSAEIGDVMRCIGTFVGHEGPIWCLAEAGGCLFSGSSDTTIKVWDIVETYQCMKTLVGHKDIVLSLHVVDGKLISGSSDLCFNVWSVETYSLIRRVKAHDNAVCTITSTQDRLFTGSLMKIKVWDLSNFALIKDLDGTSWFRALAVTDALLFAGSKESVLVWDLKTYDCLRTLEFSGGSIYSLAIINQRYLCGGTQENNIQVWDISKFEKLPELQGHTGAVYSLAAVRWPNSPSHLRNAVMHNGDDEESRPVLISGAYDRSLRAWSTDNNGQFSCAQTVTRHSGSVSCLLSCAGRFYSGAIDSTVKVWSFL